MKKESGFLHNTESDLLAELSRFFKLGGKKKILELTAKQWRLWENILRKAVEHPEFDYAKDIDMRLGNFLGCHLTTNAKRKQYGKKNLMDLGL